MKRRKPNTPAKIAIKCGGQAFYSPDGDVRGWTIHLNEDAIADSIDFLVNRGVDRKAAEIAVQSAYLAGQRDGWEISRKQEDDPEFRFVRAKNAVEGLIADEKNKGRKMSQSNAIKIIGGDFEGGSFSYRWYMDRKREWKEKRCKS